MMKRHDNRIETVQIKITWFKKNEGIATGCLVAVICVILLFVAIGVYAVNNYQTWLAHGITAGIRAVVDNSDLPHQEKSEITEIIDQIKDGYLVGEISVAELGLILESMGDCPAIPIGLVTQFEESYVVPSALNSDEKTAANLDLNRLARGIAKGQIDWEIIDEILAPISDVREDGNQRLRSPAEVSDNDLRQVLATVKEAADQAGISDVKVGIDISDEFRKSVEGALGRTIE